MKTLLSFQEFLNESLLTEGSMAKTGSKKLEPMESSKDMANVNLQIAFFLGVGTDLKSIIQCDEYSGEDEPVGDKIYNYLVSNFDMDKSSSTNVDDYEINFDPKLKVVMTTDPADGMQAYYFTSNSNF
jgi:hypothetical protein